MRICRKPRQHCGRHFGGKEGKTKPTVARYSGLRTADGGAAPGVAYFIPRSTWTPFLLPLEPTKYWKTSGRNLFRCFLREKNGSSAKRRIAKSAISFVILIIKKKTLQRSICSHVPKVRFRKKTRSEKKVTV